MTIFEADFDLVHLVILALAVFRICRFLIQDELFYPVRERIWFKYPPESTKIGYFFTCYWCMSIWVGLFVVVLYTFVPWLAIPAFTVLALSAVVGLIDHKLNN